MARTKETAKKTAAKKPVPAAKKKIPAEKKSVENTAEPFDRSKYWSTEEVAKYFGVTNGRISHLKRDGIITPAVTGSRKEGDFYKPLETTLKGLRFYRELSDSKGSRETEEMKKARERQLIARAKNEELDLAEREGQLCNFEDIFEVMGAVLSRLRINLLAISKGVAPLITNVNNTNEIAEKIHGRICRALQETVDLDLDKLMAAVEKSKGKKIS
jgi:hypothetical protein